MTSSADERHAVVAVLRDGDRWLWIQRAQTVRFGGHWAPLSGRLEAGENQAECLVREVREEVGFEVRPIGKVWECPTHDGRFTLHWWTCEIVGGALRPDPAEVSAARWLTLHEMRELSPVFEDDLRFFESIAPTL